MHLSAAGALGAAACLEFVHIPKTGGTSVEAAACRAGLPWGACHYRGHSHCRGCVPDYSFCTIAKGTPWHAPPAQHNSRCHMSGYKRCDTFTVVREPLAWATSHYHCRWWGPQHPVDINTWMRAAHKQWIPQHRYLPVTHVLRYEDLAFDVQRLTNNTVQLATHRSNPSQRRPGTLSNETVCMVARHFERDFQQFNYSYPSHC